MTGIIVYPRALSRRLLNGIRVDYTYNVDVTTAPNVEYDGRILFLLSVNAIHLP